MGVVIGLWACNDQYRRITKHSIQVFFISDLKQVGQTTLNFEWIICYGVLLCGISFLLDMCHGFSRCCALYSVNSALG